MLARARDGNGIAPSVAPGIPWLGVFLPYAPLQHLFFADPRVRALVMTSANLSEEPIAIDNDEARARLKDIADAFLIHNRDILQRCDDSVRHSSMAYRRSFAARADLCRWQSNCRWRLRRCLPWVAT